jgi:hypothetical protein
VNELNDPNSPSNPNGTMGANSVYSKMDNPLNAVDKMGTYLAQAGMFGVKTQAQGKIVALTSMMENITFVQFAAKYYIGPEGNVCKWAVRVQYEFEALGGSIEWDVVSEDEVSGTFKQDGKKDLHFSYTMAMAIEYGIATCMKEQKNEHGKSYFPKKYKKNEYPSKLEEKYGLKGTNFFLKKNYASDPMGMLKARFITKGLGFFAPHVKAGLYTPEETEYLSKSSEEEVEVEKTNKNPFSDKPTAPEETKEIEEAEETPKEKNSDALEAEIVTGEEEKTEEIKPQQSMFDPPVEEVPKKETLFDFMKSHEKEINHWARTNKHIDPKQTFEDLHPESKSRIDENREDFLKMITDFFNVSQ